ncbi:glucose-6-phosphate isomerase, partial [Salipiger sp. HF18]|nr:glucose-6-phosphate isomerase [Salipiger sp. HF18]
MWDDLKTLAAARDGRRIDALFAEDPARAASFSIEQDGMLFDFSKTQLDAEILAALIAVAEGAGVEARREAMFSGAK